MVVVFILISIHYLFVLPSGCLIQRLEKKGINSDSNINNVYLSILISLNGFRLWISLHKYMQTHRVKRPQKNGNFHET